VRHPLAQFQRATLWHVLQNYAEEVRPEAPFHLAESEPGPEDRAIAERVLNIYHRAIEYEAANVSPERRPNSGIWEMMRHEFHGELYRMLANRDVEALVAYLRNGLRQGIAHGLGPGEQVFAGVRHNPEALEINLALIADRLVLLAVAVGALPQENPEQGLYGEYLNHSIASLAATIEQSLGVDIWRPPVAGIFGAEVGPERVIDVRVPDDVYCSYRLRTLLDTFGFRRVCEIGAGYGGNAFQAARHGIAPYLIIDLPSVNVLQGYFLMKIFGGDAVRMFGEDVPERQFNIMPYWTFFNRDVQFDIVLNRDSMPEMVEPRAREYLAEIERRGCAFLSINQESEALADANGMRQLVVHRLAQSYPKLRSAGRHAYWMRKGYIEELFLPRRQGAKRR